MRRLAAAAARCRGADASLCLAGCTCYARGGREVETENAYVKQNVIAVSAEVSGRVAEVAVARRPAG